MNKLIFCIALLFYVTITKGQSNNANLLYEIDFASKHVDWKISKDTIHVDTLIGFKDLEVPIKLSWITATDPSGCFRIAYFKLERRSESKIKVTNIRSSNIPCATKFESKDKRRFESLIFSCDYSAFKGIKEYTFNGKLGSISGNGEYTITKFK